MFFQFTPTQEPVSSTHSEETSGTSTGIKLRFLRSTDGRIVIDGEGLTKVVGTSAEHPDEETLQLTSKWAHNAVSKDGSMGAWIPLARLSEWQIPASE